MSATVVSPFSSLFQDGVLLTLSCLAWSDAHSAALSCASWYQHAQKEKSRGLSLTAIESDAHNPRKLANAIQPGSARWEALLESPLRHHVAHVRSHNYADCWHQWTPKQIRSLSELPSLQSAQLLLSSKALAASASSDALAAAADWRLPASLQSLSLTCLVKDASVRNQTAWIAAAARVKSLTSLTVPVTWQGVKPSPLTPLRALPLLTALQVNGDADLDVSVIRQMPLHRLTIDGPSFWRAEGLAKLLAEGHALTLQCLNMDELEVTLDAMTLICAQLPRLTELKPKSIHKEAVALLPRMAHLATLAIHPSAGFGATLAYLEPLTQCLQLRDLALFDLIFPQAQLAQIEKLFSLLPASLDRLSITRCRMPTLGAVARCIGLRSLELEFCNLAYEDLQQLSPLAKLESLTLGQTIVEKITETKTKLVPLSEDMRAALHKLFPLLKRLEVTDPRAFP